MTFYFVPCNKNEPMNIYLLGDSILDNAAYTHGDPAVSEHLNHLLGDTGRATLLAVDGSVTAQVERQIQKLPGEATHVVLSSGGNDALAHQDVLLQPAASVVEALLRFDAPLRALETDYRRVLAGIKATGLPGLCCTIYNGWMEEPIRSVVPLALRLFNDVIISLATEYGFPVLDLRRVCTTATDYANPIEPSGPGGEKIARAILHSFSVPVSR